MKKFLRIVFLVALLVLLTALIIACVLLLIPLVVLYFCMNAVSRAAELVANQA